jgi:hypothetical protein
MYRLEDISRQLAFGDELLQFLKLPSELMDLAAVLSDELRSTLLDRSPFPHPIRASQN